MPSRVGSGTSDMMHTRQAILRLHNHSTAALDASSRILCLISRVERANDNPLLL